MKNILILISFILFICEKNKCQNQPYAIIYHPYKDFLLGCDNYFKVFISQEEKVELSQIKIEYNDYYSEKAYEVTVTVEGDGFSFNPDSIGMHTFTIRTKYGDQKEYHFIKPIIATAALGSFRFQNNEYFSIKELKQSPYLFLGVLGNGFDIKCRIEKYDFIHCSQTDGFVKILNTYSRFNEETINQINKIKIGDIIIIKNIVHKCPNKTNESYEVEPLLFEAIE